MRIGFGMRQALKRKNVPLGILRGIEDQLNGSLSQVGTPPPPPPKWGKNMKNVKRFKK